MNYILGIIAFLIFALGFEFNAIRQELSEIKEILKHKKF